MPHIHPKQSIFTIIGIITLILLTASCSSTDTCQEDLSNSNLKATLYRNIYDDVSESYTSQKFSIPVTICGIGSDSLLYDSTYTSSIAIPLNLLDSVSLYSFTTFHKINDSTTTVYTDTIQIEYSNTLQLISLECGCATMHTITSVRSTVHAVDSCVIENADVNYQTTHNNVNIFIHNQ